MKHPKAYEYIKFTLETGLEIVGYFDGEDYVADYESSDYKEKHGTFFTPNLIKSWVYLKDLPDPRDTQLAECDAQIAEMREALENMAREFKYNDHNLYFPNCKCEGHKNYLDTLAILAKYPKQVTK